MMNNTFDQQQQQQYLQQQMYGNANYGDYNNMVGDGQQQQQQQQQQQTQYRIANTDFDDDEEKINYLPEDFVPRDKDVIIGKGMTCYTHSGNEYFRQIIYARLEEYSTTKSKKDKSKILHNIVAQIRSTGGTFIKKDPDNGLWFDANDVLARDKVSQAFRNALYQSRGKRKGGGGSAAANNQSNSTTTTPSKNSNASTAASTNPAPATTPVVSVETSAATASPPPAAAAVTPGGRAAGLAATTAIPFSGSIAEDDSDDIPSYPNQKGLSRRSDVDVFSTEIYEPTPFSQGDGFVLGQYPMCESLDQMSKATITSTPNSTAASATSGAAAAPQQSTADINISMDSLRIDTDSKWSLPSIRVGSSDEITMELSQPLSASSAFGGSSTMQSMTLASMMTIDSGMLRTCSDMNMDSIDSFALTSPPSQQQQQQQKQSPQNLKTDDGEASQK